MTTLYSYVLRYDNGSAPNPFWGRCTLTICKPAIRRTAQIGDWIIGTGSKSVKLKDNRIHDLSDSLVYAMKVTDVKSLREYDNYCMTKLKGKIAQSFSKDWRRRRGDCIYDYSESDDPELRKGVHTEKNRESDLGGQNALISSQFYYFGEEPRPLPKHLKAVIKKNQGYLRIVDSELISQFEQWIETFRKNTIYADPQLRYTDGPGSDCSTRQGSKKGGKMQSPKPC